MSKRKIVLAFSGGLDTSYALVSLREQGWEVLTANIDTGGLHSGEGDVVRARAEELGSAQHFVIDAREELYARVVTYAVKAAPTRWPTARPARAPTTCVTTR
jgi:argininosuccinate synthase